RGAAVERVVRQLPFHLDRNQVTWVRVGDPSPERQRLGASQTAAGSPAHRDSGRTGAGAVVLIQRDAVEDRVLEYRVDHEVGGAVGVLTETKPRAAATGLVTRARLPVIACIVLEGQTAGRGHPDRDRSRTRRYRNVSARVGGAAKERAY